MDEKDEEAVLLCKRVGGGGIVVPGSMVKKCSACGADVWVSMESLRDAQIGSVKFRLSCMQCMPPQEFREENFRLPPATKALAEKVLGREITEGEVRMVVRELTRRANERKG